MAEASPKTAEVSLISDSAYFLGGDAEGMTTTTSAVLVLMGAFLLLLRLLLLLLLLLLLQLPFDSSPVRFLADSSLQGKKK